jgi:hypothetical protein
MKNFRSAWLVMLFLGMLFLLAFPDTVSAHLSVPLIAHINGQISGQATQTPIPVELLPLTETPEARILPSVGNNAGLVLGATTLVLIIIGGVVISSRWRSKH